MEISANSFSLRGESGLVKIVSDSPFDPEGGQGAYSERAECDLIIESNGFRVNKVCVLSMPLVRDFLAGLKELVARGDGASALRSAGEELSLAFVVQGGMPRVECSMNDYREGKENSVKVKYPIEPEYFKDLKRELANAREFSARDDR
jgi:hypothetical protein